MSYLDSYKHLEKLCGDVMGDDRRVSAYIEEMERKPNGARYVAGWNVDLKQLKHYRWVRNQIVHEPDCTEENLCGPEDVQWLEDFYDRILSGTDPLTRYRKATEPQAAPIRQPASLQEPLKQQWQCTQPLRKRKPTGCAVFLAAALLLMMLLIL